MTVLLHGLVVLFPVFYVPVSIFIGKLVFAVTPIEIKLKSNLLKVVTGSHL